MNTEPAGADLYAETRYPVTFGWSAISTLRRGEFKYVNAPRPELYDLSADPSELHDLRAERRREVAALETARAALAMPERELVPSASDAESRALLQSLGYAAPGRAPAAGGGRDPKDAAGLFQGFEEAHRDHSAGRLEPAAARLAELVAEDPGNPAFRAAYGRVLRDLGRLGEAVPLYRQAVALAPRDPQVWYELATALQTAGETAEARRALEQALRHDPGRPDAHNALAVELAGAGRLADAREHLRAALAVDERDARIWNNLGNVERGLGRADEASAAYRRAIALDPGYPDPLNGMGALEVSRQRPSAALPWFEQAITLAPHQHEARLNRAIALDVMGDDTAAAAAYRDFLHHVGSDAEYAAQRQVARQLLARLSAGEG
jgi:Flp pilus assembly protein TadD